MRILGVDLTRKPPASGRTEHTLVALDDGGRFETSLRVSTLPAVAAAVAQLAGDEPFLLGANIPVVVPTKSTRARPIEGLVRRRLGYRLPPGGRAALTASPFGLVGEALIAGLATAGKPCLPYPDRNRRTSGLAESYPGLTLKALLWESSGFADNGDPPAPESLFRAVTAPPYREAESPSRSGWADRAVALDLILRALGDRAGFDFRPVSEALAAADSPTAVDRTGALFDATLIAGTARRYLESPESTVFVGDQENGYVILPADGLIRRLVLNDARPSPGELFPQTSLRERLGEHARLQSTDLLNVPGRPRRVEASFTERPRYEFDNLDEMVWWKHCRHVAGPHLPTEGLHELHVVLDPEGEDGTALRLVRSRHRTLSFRFDPPKSWRRFVRTRDGRTYPFYVIRAIYETLPAGE